MAKKVIPLRADTEELARWQDAAEKKGMTFSAWARMALDDQANLDKALVYQEQREEPKPKPKGKCPRWMHHRSGVFCSACGS